MQEGFSFHSHEKGLLVLCNWSILFMINGLPRWLSGKESTCQCKWCRRRGLDAWVRKIPWRRKWQPTPVFLPGNSHGQRSLAGYSPRGHEDSSMTSDWAHVHMRDQRCSLWARRGGDSFFKEAGEGTFGLWGWGGSRAGSGERRKRKEGKGSPESHGVLWHPQTFRTWIWGRKLPFGSFGSRRCSGCYERCWDVEYFETENAEKYEMSFDCVNIISPLFVLFLLPDSFLGPYRWERHLLGPIPALSRHPDWRGHPCI